MAGAALDQRSAAQREAELWRVDLGTSADAIEALERETPRLGAREAERIAALADPEAQRERRVAHIALRLLIERFAGEAARGVPYEIAAHGKPALPGHTVSFSLSHVRGHALIGLRHAGQIGVDLERERPVRIMTERRRTIEEAALGLAAGAPLPLPPEPRFLTAWVRLEAVAKAEGSGVGAHLSVFLGRRPKIEQRPGPRSEGPLVARDLALGRGFFGAIALPSSIATPGVRLLPTIAGDLTALLR